MNYLQGVLVFLCSGISVIFAFTGKGHYCRDPDTGFLHPANTTWQSTTFCGNYTCKLRRRNLAPGESPLRAINITYVNITQPSKTRSADDDVIKEDNKKDDMPLDSPELVLLKSLLPAGTDLAKLNVYERLKPQQPYNPKSDSNDRYLTEAEIKTISDLLHNVRKSDLEAIVDIYSLAQDIYKEMDKMTSENVLEETMKFSNILSDKPDTKKVSYWYEPSYRLNKADEKIDMDHQGSNVVSTAAPPPPPLPVRTAAPSPSIPNSYFGAPLTKTDFGKLPYYYPMSSFQRESSYIHPAIYAQPPMPTAKPPCPVHGHIPQVIPQSYQPVAISYASPPQSYGGLLKKPFSVEQQKQSNLLPYPFSYVQPYNVSAYPYNNYMEGNPWAQFDLYNNHNQKSYYKSQISDIHSKSASANDDKKDVEQNTKTDQKKTLLDTLVANAKDKVKDKTDWKTDPIPAHILDEVRAHFEEKAKLLKPLSLRKKIKLEKVGKVLKLDDLHREKRSLDDAEKLDNEDEGDMEAYIEKTTCLSDIDPGYFRMGNLTEPYPACCPQRITEGTR